MKSEKLLGKETHFLKLFQRTKNDHDKLSFQVARREANRLKRNAIKRYNDSTVHALSKKKTPTLQSSGLLLNRFLGNKCDQQIPSLSEINKIINDDRDKADIFNKYFSE